MNNQKKVRKKQQSNQVKNEMLFQEISDQDAQALSGGRCPLWWICPGG